LIDASVSFSDLLDQHVYGIKVSPDQTIQPGKTVEDTGNYRVNQFISEQMRMKDMKKEDIKIQLTVRKLVFTDHTVLEIAKD
jgi:hypothetical protein